MRDEPVLLLHGFATSHRRTWVDNGWTALLDDAGRRWIGVDLLGHGDAPKPHDPEAYEALEDHVVAALPDEPVDAVAFSLGARVLLTIAATAPERFGRLVVAGVGANLLRDDRSDVILRAVRGDGDSDDPMSQYFAGLAADPQNDRTALAALLQRNHPPLTPTVLSGVDRPVLVVLGDRDFAGPPDPLVDALPDATLVTLRGVDHFSTPKDFGFIEAALDFLDAQAF